MTETDIRQKNIKLYPIYKMFSWDLIFYYVINFLFLTQVKGLTASDILLADAFYPLAKLALQIPCVMLVDWLGKRKSIIIANISICFILLFLIIGNGLITLIIFNIVLAFAFNLKDMCESSILYDSISDSNEKLDTFSKLDGKGTSFHYYLDAICCIATGFLFVINPYIPMLLCVLFMCIAVFISFCFKDSHKSKTPKQLIAQNHTEFNNYILELKNIFTFIIKSDRLKGLLFFSAVFTALASILSTLRTSILVELNVPEIYFGIIVAGIQILSGFTSKRHLAFNKWFRNRTLSLISLGNTILLILTGLSIFCNLPIAIVITIIVIWFVFYSITKGIYYPVIKRYLNSFTIPRVNTKIYASQTIFNSFARIPISLFASYILSITNTSTSFILIGSILSIVFIFLLNYMNGRVGLKPEEYNKKDIYYLEPTLK